MTADPHYWTLPDLPSALAHAAARRRHGIRCSLAALCEYAKVPADAFAGTTATIRCIRSIAGKQLDAAVSVKLTALGSTVDPNLCLENLRLITTEAKKLAVPLEIDMEGKGLVEFTIEAARACADVYDQVTLALQAYLDRTAADLAAVSARGITVRLVKGAYTGDSSDFSVIQERFRALAIRLGEAGRPFSVGTHDPELVAWMEDLAEWKELVEFGFLLGLSERTKLRLVSAGFAVSEYVPFGPGGSAYRARRERYLAGLAAGNREPAP